MIGHSFGFISEEDVEQTAKVIGETLNKVRHINYKEHYIAVPKRVKEFAMLYHLCVQIANRSGAEVTYSMATPRPTIGTISIIGNSIELTTAQVVQSLTKLASNWEVHPRTDGKIQMDITCYGLAKEVGVAAR